VRGPVLAGGYNRSYTKAVKTAISIPDALFAAAEHLALRLGVSRSRLFSQAIAEYLKTHAQEGLTETLNRLYDREPSKIDPMLEQMQVAELPPEDW